MPNYGVLQAGSNSDESKNLTDLIPGQWMYLFNAETPAEGQASVAFNRGPAPGTEVPSGIIFTVFWATTPTAQMDIEGANTDVDSQYIALGSVINQNGYYSDAGGFAYYRAKQSVYSAGGAVTVIAQR